MAKITVYTTDPCSFCTRAKQLLTTRELTFDEINLSKDPEGRAALVAADGHDELPAGHHRERDGRWLHGAGRRRPQRPAARAHRGRRLRTPRGRGWQRSHTYVPRPAATNFTISPPHDGHGSPRRRWTRNSSWKAPQHPVGVAEVVDRRAARGEAGARARRARPRRRRPDWRARQPSRGAQRVDARAEQRLVGVDVADAGDPALVEQERLDRRACARGPGARSSAPVSASASGSTPSRAAKNASSARRPRASSPVPKRRGSQKRSSCAPVVEGEAHALVGRVVARVEQQRAGHPQVHEQERRRPRAPRRGTCRGGQPLDAAARDRVDDGLGRQRQAPARVGDPQRAQLAPLDDGRQLAADRLDLGQLGHRSQSRSRRARTGPRTARAPGRPAQERRARQPGRRAASQRRTVAPTSASGAVVAAAAVAAEDGQQRRVLARVVGVGRRPGRTPWSAVSTSRSSVAQQLEPGGDRGVDLAAARAWKPSTSLRCP